LKSSRHAKILMISNASAHACRVDTFVDAWRSARQPSPLAGETALRDLENGSLSQNAVLRDGDTIFVPRAQSVYVFGQVKNPGAYSLQQNKMTVLQALSLAGGVTENGSTNRIKIVRMVKGDKVEIKVKLGDIVQPGDTVIVPERYF